MAIQRTLIRRDSPLAVVLGISLLFLVIGCGQKGIRTIGRGVTPTAGQITKEELREQLDQYREFFRATLGQTAHDLNERVPTARTEKTTLQMRTRMVQGLSAMLDRDDPVVAFIETWGLCVRFRTYLDEGEGNSLFGEAQKLALNAAQRLEMEIERIGGTFLKDEVFETARKNVNEFAQSNPIRGAFSNVTIYATQERKDQPNPFLSILKVPMTPFRAMEGVDRTASAIHQFRDTAERFSDIVAELPESSRWQLQLLLFELEETDMIKSFLNSLQQFAESSSRLENSVQKLPENLREQLTMFVKDVDRQQENLRKTLQQTEKTTLAVQAALDQLDKAIGSLDAATVNITETAQAWEIAAKATGQVVEEFNKSKQTSEKKEETSFDINDYRMTAEKISQAANDIQTLLATVEGFPRSQGYSSMLTHLLFRIAGLAILIFVLAVLYRFVTVRLMRPKSNKTT